MSALRDALRDLPDAVFADVLESDGEYLVVLDLPGVRADTVEVSTTRGRLRIEARREKEVPREFRYLQEDRALFLDADLPLPPDAGAEGASGTVEKGVLELRLPKRDRRAGTSIPIEGENGDRNGSTDDDSETDLANDIETDTDTDTDTDADDASDDSASDS
jgi:HSP20 family molecular chaperone IbpA